MRKIWLIFIALFLCIDDINAAGRATNTLSRQSARNESIQTSRGTQKRIVTSRMATKKQTDTSRSASKRTVSARSATKKTTVSRAALPQPTRSRATTLTSQTKTFGQNYNLCRDAYFSCMDQFCATLNENYRRCICSSKLKDIQSMEKSLSQTATSLQGFEYLNIDAISKTAAEVKAMSSGTSGESAIKKDKSDAATTLQNISGVLNDTKKQSLSTAGKLDIAGDIRAIWSTTDLIGGSDIANLTGESLFNAVHAQCGELVKESCGDSDLKMVFSAYGMYIENDCAILQNNLDSKKTAANASIRNTRHKMQDARLENYNAHNSLSVDDCISKIREDLTQDTACGEGYIHCLDFSGKYLNISSGEAIYSPDFYQIENQISLSGDVLKNKQNSSFITMLNRKRPFAEKDLDLCRDDADYVWNEFMRQALVEIYQGQQKRVATVKQECLQVVNECYLKQSDSLKKFADNSSPITFVQTLELSEEMCADKLNSCSNLYGGGPDGLNILVATMTGITNLSIEQSCPDLLATFAQSLCAVPGSDSSHSYPYGCRKYAPGETHYARNALCNETLVNPFSRSDIITTHTIPQTYTDYLATCSDYTKIYTSCRAGYYLYKENGECYNQTGNYCFSASKATECRICPPQSICPGGTKEPVNIDNDLYQTCGQYYIGSLYQQLVIYALQNCTRTTDTSNVLSESLLADVDKVAKSIRNSLVSMLSKECTNLNGIWVDSMWTDEDNDGYHDISGDTLFNDFYTTTGANKLWGYCKNAQ